MAPGLGAEAYTQRKLVRFTTAAELLFHVVAGRAEQAAGIVTTNLPFSEWYMAFPSARLCQAMLDWSTNQAHIIDTGKESYRFRQSLGKTRGKGWTAAG